MGFMDKAKKLAEQAQAKLDEAQKQFNSGQGGQQSSGSAVEYDSAGRPIRRDEPVAPAPAPPAQAPTPPHGDPLSSHAAPETPSPATAGPTPDAAAPPVPETPAVPPTMPPAPPSGDDPNQPPKLSSGDPLAG
jgi:hypothetical protein